MHVISALVDEVTVQPYSPDWPAPMMTLLAQLLEANPSPVQNFHILSQ